MPGPRGSSSCHLSPMLSRFLGLEGVVLQLPHPIAIEVDGGAQSTDPLVSGLGLSCRPHLSPHVWPACSVPSTREGWPWTEQLFLVPALRLLGPHP